MYEDLKQLAEERSSEKRLELFRRVSEMYFEGVGAHNDTEEYLFGEIMDKIVDTVAKTQKLIVSTEMATHEYFPHAIVRKLAGDADIEIAQPVIANSPVLTDDDLVDLANRNSQAHLNVIASRPALSESVTDALIDKGDAQVAHTVSANHGARFSDRGMDGLLAKAVQDVDLRELLVERPDLSQNTVAKLTPLVSANLAIRLAERGYDVGDALPPNVLAAVSKRLAAALRERRGNVRDTASLVEAVRREQLTLDEAVSMLAKTGRLVDLSALISHFANADRGHVFSLLANGQVQAVMLLCRSLGLSWTTLEDVLAFRAHKRGDQQATPEETRTAYNRIDSLVAQRALRFSHVRRAANS